MDPWDNDIWMPGVLSIGQMRTLKNTGYILGVDNFDNAVDYSSIDLHLSNEGYLMKKGSIKPCGDIYNIFLDDVDIAERLKPENGKYLLEKEKCYVFKLKESLSSKLNNPKIQGQATAKSSIGRLDIIARLIVDGMYKYESFEVTEIAKTFTGNMYLEIIPISYNINVAPGNSLSQLRFFLGSIEDSIIKDQNFLKLLLKGTEHNDSSLSVDLTNCEFGKFKACAFASKKNGNAIDLSTKGAYMPSDFWDILESENERLVIKNNRFYILRSRERICLPSRVAVYCKAMDETLGEMRIHYAGFVHPYFGQKRQDKFIGSPLIFEVRGHNIDVNLSNNEKLAKLEFYRMSKDQKYIPNKNAEYMGQELKLSKYFKEWDN